VRTVSAASASSGFRAVRASERSTTHASALDRWISDGV
jgi:hypothetical protein